MSESTLVVTDSDELVMHPRGKPLPHGWRFATAASVNSLERRPVVPPASGAITMAPNLKPGPQMNLWKGNNSRTWRDADTGELRQERLPSLTHVYDDFATREPTVHPAAQSRYVVVLRHDGNVSALCLTNSSAHLDTSTSYANFMRAKARHYGWIPVGSCPLEMIRAETPTLRADQVEAKEILKEETCARGTYDEEHPCPHFCAERDHRRRNTAADQRALLEHEQAQLPPTPEKIAAAAAAGIGAELRGVFAEILGTIASSKKRGS